MTAARADIVFETVDEREPAVCRSAILKGVCTENFIRIDEQGES
jgi:hypothetical protein